MPLANTDSQVPGLGISSASPAGAKSTEGKGSRLGLDQAVCPEWQAGLPPST